MSDLSPERMAGQRIVRFTLMIAGIALAALVAMSVAVEWLFTELREQRELSHRQHEVGVEFQGLLDEFTATGREQFHILFSASTTPPPDERWVTELLTRLRRSNLAVGEIVNDDISTIVGDSIKMVESIGELWSRSLLWYRQFMRIKNAAESAVLLKRMNAALAALQESVEIHEGNERLELAVALRATGSDSSKREELVARWMEPEHHNSQRWLGQLRSDLADLRLYLAMLEHEAQLEYLGNLKDNLLLPVISRLGSELRHLPGAQLEGGALERFTTLGEAVFGRKYQIDNDYQTIWLGGGGFFELREMYLELSAELERLEAEWHEQGLELAHIYQHMVRSSERRGDLLAAGLSAMVSEGRNHLHLLNLLVMIALLPLSWLVIVQVRRQIVLIGLGQEKLRAVMDSVSDAIITYTEAGVIVECNSVALRMFGREHEGLIGRQVGSLVFGVGGVNPFLPRGSTASASGEPVTCEATARRPGTDGFPVEITVSRSAKADEMGFSHTAVIHDITQRKRMMDDLALSLHTTRLILDTAGDGIYGVALNGNTTFVNDSAVIISGWSQDELIGHHQHSILHHTRPDGTPYPSNECNIYRTLRDGVVRKCDSEVFWRRDKTSFPVEYTVTPIHDAGTIVGGVVVFRDITERKQAADREIRSLISRVLLSALLETGLEPLSLIRQLEVALDIVLTAAWLSLLYKGSIFLVDPETGELLLTAQRNLAPPLLKSCKRVTPGFCLCGRAAQTREIVFASNLDHRHDIMFEGISDHGHYCIPLIYSERLLGVLNIYVAPDHRTNPEEEAFLVTVGNTLAGLIAHRQVEAELAREQQFKTAILGTISALVVVLDVAGRIVQFNRACEEITGYSNAEAVGRRVWEFLITEDEVATVERCFLELTGQGLPNQNENFWVCKTGERRWITWSNTVLMDGAGRIQHVLATGIDITERKHAEERLRHLAHHDPLTELPNRALFLDHLERAVAMAKRDEQGIAVFFIDLDRFKQVNDTLGHEAGDELLVGVSKRLKGALRESDVVARLGGDEFTVLLQPSESQEEAVQIATRIIETLSTPFMIQEQACHIGASIGIGLYPEHSNTPDQLVKQADCAMYHVKQHGKNGCMVYHAGMESPPEQQVE